MTTAQYNDSFPVGGSVQDIERAYQGQQIGTWAYAAGVSGARSVSGKVQAITAISVGGGSMQINSGDTIPLPKGIGITFTPQGNLLSPSLLFTGTDSYFVELLQ